eukprot:4555155-Lingulodinium_polyedra.AAC.1
MSRPFAGHIAMKPGRSNWQGASQCAGEGEQPNKQVDKSEPRGCSADVPIEFVVHIARSI